MTRASRVNCRSVSMNFAPSSTARRNAAIVFSGACPEAPRCATTHKALSSLQLFHIAREKTQCPAILADLAGSVRAAFEDPLFPGRLLRGHRI